MLLWGYCKRVGACQMLSGGGMEAGGDACTHSLQDGLGH